MVGAPALVGRGELGAGFLLLYFTLVRGQDDLELAYVVDCTLQRLDLRHTLIPVLDGHALA